MHPINQYLFMLELQQRQKSEQKSSLSFQNIPFCLKKKKKKSNCPSYRGRRRSLALFHIIYIILDGLSLTYAGGSRSVAALHLPGALGAVAFIQDCHHCRFAAHHFSSWVEPRPWKGSSFVGCCHGGSPRSQCSCNLSPGAANWDPLPCRPHQTGTKAVQAPSSEVPFSQVSFCFVSVSPSSLWQRECVGPQKFICHTVFFVLLACLG